MEEFKSLKSKKTVKIAILFIIIFFTCIPPIYAVENENLVQDIKVEVNYDVMKMQERKLPSLYLGSIQRNYTSYNLGEKLQLNVKNQGNTQICWACSSNSALETTVNLAQNTNYVFSDEELSKQVSERYGISQDNGANSYIAYGYYTSGESPVTTKQEQTDIKIENYTIFPTIYKKIEGSKITYQKAKYSSESYSEEEVEVIRNSIKNHIVNNGAVTALTYSDSRYFSENLQAYYCDNNAITPNHQVTIVGWDDNYSVENFNSEHRPQNNGAYIVLNSYGTDFGNGGLFYISYEDIFVEYSNMGINKTASYDKEENIYQHDELGINNTLGFKADTYAANVYTRKTQKLERITSVSFANLENGEYEIYINQEDGTLDSNKLKKVKEITTQKAGYTTVDIEPITLYGNQFVIAIKSKTTSTSNTNFGIEYNDGKLWKNANNERGQTYFSVDAKTWYDIKDLESEINGIDNANVCIKAFTKETSRGDINLDESFDIRDLSIALQYFGNTLDSELSEEAYQNLDLNYDDKIDLRDLSKMILILANLE